MSADQLAEALEELMAWQVKHVKVWNNSAYDNAHRVLAAHRAQAGEAPFAWTRDIQVGEDEWDAEVIVGATHPNELGMPNLVHKDWRPLFASPHQVAQWQPIETAPTDGTWFLAHKPTIADFVALILDTDHPDCEYDGGVHCSWDHKYVDGVTHWMPLPAAPTTTNPKETP